MVSILNHVRVQILEVNKGTQTKEIAKLTLYSVGTHRLITELKRLNKLEQLPTRTKFEYIHKCRRQHELKVMPEMHAMQSATCRLINRGYNELKTTLVRLIKV